MQASFLVAGDARFLFMKSLREGSDAAKSGKSMDIMDVNGDAVAGDQDVPAVEPLGLGELDPIPLGEEGAVAEQVVALRLRSEITHRATREERRGEQVHRDAAGDQVRRTRLRSPLPGM